MIIVCSWCEKSMGEKEPFEDKNITHGICQPCYSRALSGNPQMVPRIGSTYRAEGEQVRTFKVICIDSGSGLVHLHREPGAIVVRMELARLENMITHGAFKLINS